VQISAAYFACIAVYESVLLKVTKHDANKILRKKSELLVNQERVRCYRNVLMHACIPLIRW